MKFKNCCVLATRDFFVNPAVQSKYPDDILQKETQIKGTITSVPNPQKGMFQFEIKWWTNGSLPVSFDLTDLCHAVIQTDNASASVAQLKDVEDSMMRNILLNPLPRPTSDSSI
jgi:hypothetical protein